MIELKKNLNKLLILLSAILIIQCGKDEDKSLRVVNTYNIDIPEPSGLDFSFDRSGLWTVSDKNDKVYLLDMKGNILNSFEADGPDIEGIASINEQTLGLVTETDREIILVSTTGKELRKIDVKSGNGDSGLEGLAYNRNNKEYYVANEKSPKVIIKLDSTLSEINRYDISFANDLSGLYIDAGYLWVLSDESRSITKCNLSCEALESWKIDAESPEGIAVDYENRLVYVVSDPQSRLHVFQLP